MNKIEFQQKITEANKPVIIDFWATWCGPCMTTKPILDKLAKEYADKINFMPINADDSREVLEQFRIFGIPTVITLKNGKEVGRVTGAQTEKNYRAMFEALAEGSKKHEGQRKRDGARDRDAQYCGNSHHHGRHLHRQLACDRDRWNSDLHGHL